MMAQGYEAAVRDLGRLYDSGTLAGLGEADLLGRFAAVRDESAFEALVVRHGPMVRGVCRGVLGDPHAADDAFQATFLVLARRSSTIRRGDRLGPWLHRVATRVALRSRAIASHRSRRESADPDAVAKAVAPRSPSEEVVRIVHEEIDRLPEKYRRPVVLCYLEGRSHAEAAGRLDWPLGSVKGRLSRARDLLKTRLERRGLSAPAGVVAALFAADANASVPPELVQQTVAASVAVAGRGAPLVAGAGATAAAILLAQGALTIMRLQRIVAGTLVATTLLGLLGGSALIARAGRADDPAAKRKQAKAAQPAAVAEELSRLAGRYERVSTEVRGKILDMKDEPAIAADPSLAGLVVRGDGFYFGNSTEPERVTIDPGRDPKWLELKPTSATGGYFANGAAYLGIYKLEGDTLTLSLDVSAKAPDGPRPTAFATDANTPWFTDVYRRVGPAPEPPADPRPDPAQDKAAQPAAIDEELAKLAGRYERTAVHMRGQLTYGRDDPTMKLDPASMGLVIRGNEFYFGNSPEPEVATIDPGQDPKWIDLKPTAAAAGPTEWVSSRGIYKLEGDTLTLALDPGGQDSGRRRPGWFGTAENTPWVTSVYRRVGPAPDGPVGAAAPPAQPVEAATGMLIEPDPAQDDPAAADARAVELDEQRLNIELLQIEVKSLEQQIRNTALALQGARHAALASPELFGVPRANNPEQVREQLLMMEETEERDLDSLRRAFREKSQELLRTRRELAAAEAEESRRSRSEEPLRENRLAPGDRVRVEVLEALPGRPLTGVRVVRPDGTISLDFYGDLMAAGLTRNELKVALVERLRKWIPEETLGLTATHPDGTVKPVAPADSDRVFVDDLPDAYPLPEGDSSRIDALERKIDALLRRLDSGDRLGPDAQSNPRRLGR